MRNASNQDDMYRVDEKCRLVLLPGRVSHLSIGKRRSTSQFWSSFNQVCLHIENQIPHSFRSTYWSTGVRKYAMDMPIPRYSTLAEAKITIYNGWHLYGRCDFIGISSVDFRSILPLSIPLIPHNNYPNNEQSLHYMVTDHGNLACVLTNSLHYRATISIYYHSGI